MGDTILQGTFHIISVIVMIWFVLSILILGYIFISSIIDEVKYTKNIDKDIKKLLRENDYELHLNVKLDNSDNIQKLYLNMHNNHYFTLDELQKLNLVDVERRINENRLAGW
jgi:hypothetical protein